MANAEAGDIVQREFSADVTARRKDVKAKRAAAGRVRSVSLVRDVCLYLPSVCSGDASALKGSDRETCRPARCWLVIQE